MSAERKKKSERSNVDDLVSMEEIGAELPPTPEQIELEELEANRRDSAMRFDDDGDNDVRPLKITPKLLKKAERLLKRPDFLYRAGRALEQLGVVGEQRNRLIVFLACGARSLPQPPSVIMKGTTASGKSSVVNGATQLFDPALVKGRSGLSGKALACGQGSLAGKILLIDEYRCGKDAQQLLRILQSEGHIAHEYTVSRGRRRDTEITVRTGSPVTLTTTTAHTVYIDDETRYLTLWSDESEQQTLEILQARLSPPKKMTDEALAEWRAATSLLVARPGDFRQHPRFLQFVARCLPRESVRVRRDWSRFLVFCCAVSLCSGRREKEQPLNISISDYCVAHELLNQVFAATLEGMPGEEVELVRTVARLNRQHKRGVTAQEIADDLKCDRTLAYKKLRAACAKQLLNQVPGTHAKNLKYYEAKEKRIGEFLPSPGRVLGNCPELGGEVKYIDPLTGETVQLQLKKRAGGKIGGVAPNYCKHGVKQGVCANCAGFLA